MTKKINIINNIISLLATIGSAFLVVFFAQKNYYTSLGSVILFFILGAIIAGLINTFVHELGHIVVGKKNGYKFYALTVWFFKWKKINGRLDFSFTMMRNEAGWTEMIPTDMDKAGKGFYKTALGGIMASLIMVLISIPPLFLTDYLPFVAYSLWAIFLPVSVYFLLGAGLPMTSGGVRNDGAVCLGFRKGDDQSKVMENLLKIQAELYAGKSYKEIEEGLYFDLPQLAEDNPAFVNLLVSRYNYYLDKEDFENAKKTSERLTCLAEEYMPKDWRMVVKADALYNACTFDFNEEKADDLMYEVEKYVNADNSITNVRIKCAYLAYILKDLEPLEMFFEKAEREAKKCPLQGVAKHELKLIEKIKNAVK